MDQRRTCLAPVLLLAAACGGGAVPEAKNPDLDPAAQARLRKLLPLRNGTVLAYDTRDQSTGETGIVMLRVRRPREGRVDLDDGGRVQRLELTPAAVSHATGGYLLKLPLVVGATFDGRFGVVNITRTDVAIEVPAGTFSNCLETVEEASGGGSASTVFCPDVGIVALDVEQEERGVYRHVSMRLRSFGPVVDLGVVTEPEAPPE